MKKAMQMSESVEVAIFLALSGGLWMHIHIF